MTAPPCGKYGDINDDGNVDSADFMLAISFINGSKIPTAEEKIRADVDGDGEITYDDVQLIQDFMAGTITTFPVCDTPTPPPTGITCDNGGCALLLRYDTGNDGVISASEFMKAANDHSNGIITAEEATFVEDAWKLGSINSLCPGCYSGTPTPPNMETRTMSLTEGTHTIQIALSGYDTLNATINVSSTGVTCTVGPCNTQGPPGVVTSGWTVTTYLKTGVVTSDVCTWINTIGGWRNLQWTSHVLEAYYVYIGAAGHSVGFSPVTWNDVLGLYYYYINDPTAGNGKIGCGT